ncbi:hypothetical protein FA09DRAFT_337884 [Tilletiopsis washingtonensis]|uniref:rRNA-processing protein n=1 Tax=Tilletiopsis washingtonensis TaxID=58919 RepID=A0A316ZFN9_9BASI|nr:hypothetical protein FA09DRAFT_337884 [Tilletiopsis washingtonensis]PWN99165.1 hypothetical protein FA09DRAFT_337884 [Tilletiopsis washingtonensis]
MPASSAASTSASATTAAATARGPAHIVPPPRAEQHLAGVARISSWDSKVAARQRAAEVKAKEKAMKAEREEADKAKTKARMERRQKVADKARLEALAAKMSGKRLDRHKRRLGLTKKVAH